MWGESRLGHKQISLDGFCPNSNAKLVDDDSDFLPWSFIGTVAGSQGSITWDTTDYDNGVYYIAFDMYDQAGNWGPESQPVLTANVGGNQVDLPLVIK